MRIAIIGGTGSLGTALVDLYTRKDWQVTVLSRDPHKQVALRSQYPGVRFVLGDVCDYARVREAVEGQDYVIHTAANKIVALGERFPEEYIRVNILGSQTVARACREAITPVAILISSDKGVEPINLYGRTKAIAEDIFASHGYSALRYGNVVNSRGSFLEIWRAAVKNNQPIEVRVPDPTRFILLISVAVALVEEAIRLYQGGEIFVPHGLHAFSIAQARRALHLNNYPYFNRTDLLAGEKRHERLLSEFEQGREVSDRLCVVHKGYQGQLNHADFCSETAPRLTDAQLHDIIYADFWAAP